MNRILLRLVNDWETGRIFLSIPFCYNINCALRRNSLSFGFRSLSLKDLFARTAARDNSVVPICSFVCFRNLSLAGYGGRLARGGC